MEIFYNTEWPNYDQIVAMGPKWWTEYREMDANYKYAGWTLDLMAYFLERIVLNEFPSQCDEETLRMYELLMQVEYEEEMTLEERRRVVSAYWSGNGKLSQSVIASIVSSYTGQEADIRWENDNLTLVIDFDNTDVSNVSMSMLQKILRRRMPAHIDYQIRCMAIAHIALCPKKKYWQHSFDIVGTLPNTSTGLGLNKDALEMGTSGTGYKSYRPRAGEQTTIESESDGTAPNVLTHSYTVEYRMCGNAFEI